VLNAVDILTAKEDYIQKMLGYTTATNTIHSYLVDTLATAGSLAVAEADDFTTAALTTPTRLTNIVQKIAKDIKVTGTQQRIEHYSGNELARQRQKSMVEWANALEFDLVRSSMVSGASGTTPKMAGIIYATSKSTNHTTHTSGTVWSATILDGLMKDCYDNSNGDVATDLFMGSYLRSITDGFTQKSNVVVNNPGGQTTIVRTVTTYETAFGTVRLHTHRYVQQSTDATGRVLAINPDKLKIAWLQKPFIKKLAENGDYTHEALIGECTLEVHNQDSCWFADGFLKS